MTFDMCTEFHNLIPFGSAFKRC